jgi:hypothetical protein
MRRTTQQWNPGQGYTGEGFPAPALQSPSKIQEKNAVSPSAKSPPPSYLRRCVTRLARRAHAHVRRRRAARETAPLGRCGKSRLG